MDLRTTTKQNSFCRFLFDYLPTTYYYYYYNVLVPHKQTLILYIKVEIKPKMFLHEKNDDTKIFIKFSKKTLLQAVLPGKTLVNLTDIIVNLLKVSIPTKH